MGYQNGGRRYFYRAGSCVFLLFLLVISLTTFLHPASRSEERAPEASLQRGVASARYDNLSFGIPGKADCIVDREGFALGYIEYHEQPAWVIYKLTRTEVQAKVAKRTNRFREDLFYRLSVVNIALPPLRERRQEIPQLVARFAAEFARENNRPVTGISPEALRALIDYPWPGNIRELRNCIESMVVLAQGPLLEVRDLPASVRHPEQAEELLPHGAAAPAPGDKPLKLEDNERILIDEALRKCNGNRTAAAKLLGISRRTLHRKLAK